MMSTSTSIQQNKLYHKVYQLVFKAETADEGKQQYKNLFRFLSMLNTSTLKKSKRRTLKQEFIKSHKFLIGQKEYGKERKPHYHMIIWVENMMSLNTFKTRLKSMTDMKIQVSKVKQTADDIQSVEKYVCKGNFLTYKGYLHDNILEILARWKPAEQYKKLQGETIGMMLRREAQIHNLDITDSYKVSTFVMNYMYRRGIAFNSFRYFTYCETVRLSDEKYRLALIDEATERLDKYG